MSHSKLFRRIRRELKANPKKAAGLGLLVGVALYFWAPLIWGSIDAASPPGALVTASVSALPAAAVAQTSTKQAENGVPSELVSHGWQQIVQWRRQDPRTEPAAGLAIGRDPFQRSAPGVAETEATQEKEVKQTPAAPVWTPERLGLAVSGTIVGRHRSLALINGRAYSEGETIELANEGQPIGLTVAEIHPRRIVLRWQNQKMELTIPSGEDNWIKEAGSR